MIRLSRNAAFWALAFGALLFIGRSLLWPGVTGPFVFDDFINISRLRDVGCVTDQYSFLWFLFGGTSATGRPLSFLTFLLHDNCWPTSPLPFKQFNVYWHLLNFVLVFVLVRKILRFSRVAAPEWPALMLAGLWLVHPINVSGVFLTVQRMTLLMSTCVMLGLLMYLHGREIVAQRLWRGQALMWGGLALAGILGVLFKESALSVVFYVLALEVTVLATVARGNARLWKLFLWICVLIPMITVLGYIFLDPHSLLEKGWLKRSFTPYESFLTAFRVLSDYLQQILLPDLSDFGIYHDDFPVSRSLFSPVTTVFAMLGWALLLGSALVFRNRVPLFSFGVFWFVGGHFLEGFVLPLENYFEHRNYLPLIGVFVSLYALVYQGGAKIRRVAVFFWVLLMALFSFMTFSNASVWGDGTLLSHTWLRESPESTRAAQQYAQWLFLQGRHQESARVLEEFNQQHTGGIGVRSSGLVLSCPEDFGKRWEELVEYAYTAPYSNALNDTVNKVLLRNKGCDEVTTDRIRQFLRALMSNPRYTSTSHFLENLYLLYAYSYRKDGNLPLAMYFADRAFDVRPEPLIPFNQALWLLEAGLNEEALRYIRIAQQTPERTKLITLKGRPVFDDVEKLIRKRLENSVQREDKSDGGDPGQE